MHMLTAAGVFAPNRDCHLAPPGGWREIAELWRHAGLRRLRDAGEAPFTAVMPRMSPVPPCFSRLRATAPLQARLRTLMASCNAHDESPGNDGRRVG
jgi:hypothetical protein